LLKFSDEELELHTSILMLISQVYPILIATAASINSNNPSNSSGLTLFDAHFAVYLTASPVTLYLVYSAIRNFFKIPNALFEDRLKVSKGIICLAALCLPIFWLGLHITMSFSTTAFSDSYLCKGMTFSIWIEYLLSSFYLGQIQMFGNYSMWNDLIQRKGLGVVTVVVMWFWGAYAVAHRKDLTMKYNQRRQEQKHLRFLMRMLHGGFQLPMTLWSVLYFIVCTKELLLNCTA
jgi:hypothetical protein